MSYEAFVPDKYRDSYDDDYDTCSRQLENMMIEYRECGNDYSVLDGAFGSRVHLECLTIQSDDELEYCVKPTAEWSRIQERLKRADELEADLERVKTIKDQVVKNCNRWRGVAGDRTEELDIVSDELASLKSRLPVNADGDVVLWGDTQFIGENGLIMDIQADKIIPYGGEWIIESDDGQTAYLSSCHTTSESCRGAG